MGPYVGSLKKSESLDCWTSHSRVPVDGAYSNVYPWPVATDGTGHSLVLAYPSYGEGDARRVDIKRHSRGSPGRWSPFTPSTLRPRGSSTSFSRNTIRGLRLHRALQPQHERR